MPRGIRFLIPAFLVGLAGWVCPVMGQEVSAAPAHETVLIDQEGHGADQQEASDEHAADDGPGEEGGHGPLPPLWLCIPFVVLLLMIATGPLFYSHHWHNHYPKYAVGLGAFVGLIYVVFYGTTVPVMHAAVEYLSFIALLASLFIASSTILIKTDYPGNPKTNSLLLLFGGAISNFIGTTGASMLLIRPYMRLNAGRLKAYHIVFFIFIISNVGGALTPIGDPPLFLGFLRGVPFFWTVVHVWYIWLPTVLALVGIFWVIDSRNKAVSNRDLVAGTGRDVEPGSAEGEIFPVKDERTRKHLIVKGKMGFVWLALVVLAVFIDPNVFTAMKGTPLDLVGTYHLPFGIREIIMFGICVLAYKTANPEALKGNDFNFEPIREVGFLFIGIFLTMQPALTLIGNWASVNADSIGVTTFFFGTGVLSGVLDNAPTYVSFLSAAMGKFGSDVNVPADVLAFALGSSIPAETFYLQAISVAAVFFGALTYIGNGPNFMVKAIAESSGVETPSFVGYMVKYSLPILIPTYIIVWFIFFSGYVIPHPADAVHAAGMVWAQFGPLLTTLFL